METERPNETWKEALCLALCTLWALAGALIPAPVLPFYFVHELGLGWAIVLSGLAMIIWIGGAVLFFRQAQKLRRIRFGEEKGK